MSGSAALDAPCIEVIDVSERAPTLLWLRINGHNAQALTYCDTCEVHQ
jgi:hypothetical protein